MVSPRTSYAKSRSRGRSHTASRLVVMLTGGIVIAIAAASAGPAAINQAPESFPRGPHFVLSCGFSHRNNDDPIVFPGQPGRSHNHTFIGNFSVNAATTPTSLRRAKQLQLRGRRLGVLGTNAVRGAPRNSLRRPCDSPGRGVRLLHQTHGSECGSASSRTQDDCGQRCRAPAAEEGVAAWSCSELGEGPRFAVIPACARDHLVQVQITFPNCWNGASVDSVDHKRHMAYASAGRCPASHPVSVPSIVLILMYPEVRGHAQVASGKFAIHADFMNGGTQATLRRSSPSSTRSEGVASRRGSEWNERRVDRAPPGATESARNDLGDGLHRYGPGVDRRTSCSSQLPSTFYATWTVDRGRARLAHRVVRAIRSSAR